MYAQLAEKQAVKTLQQAESYYNSHAHRLPDLQNGSMVALQNSLTKLWDIYGTLARIVDTTLKHEVAMSWYATTDFYVIVHLLPFLQQHTQLQHLNWHQACLNLTVRAT